MGKMINAVMAAFVLMAVVACSSKENKPDFAAAETAKEYYDSLNNGGYKYFTSMYFRKERIPDSYREQLEANTKMYLFNLRKDHGGISEVRVLDCKNDAKGETAEAYLLMCFTDSVKEEIVVSMVKTDGRWMMR